MESIGGDNWAFSWQDWWWATPSFLSGEVKDNIFLFSFFFLFLFLRYGLV